MSAPRHERSASPTPQNGTAAARSGRYVTPANQRRAAEIYAKATRARGQEVPGWVERVIGR